MDPPQLFFNLGEGHAIGFAWEGGYQLLPSSPVLARQSEQALQYMFALAWERGHRLGGGNDRDCYSADYVEPWRTVFRFAFKHSRSQKCVSSL